MANKKGKVILDDSELFRIQRRYEELEAKYKKKKKKDPVVDSARKSAGLDKE